MNLAIIFIVFVVILSIILKFVFRLASILKVFVIALIVSIIVFSITIYIMYINDIDYELLGIGNKYVIGQIVSNEGNKIKVRVTDHNLDGNINVNQTIAIKITDNTVVRSQSKFLVEEKKEISDIKVGNRVNVLCLNNDSNEIISKKIVIRY